ncbi:unnamed protein product [Protopolystoma xenopodis]|uniref:Uncharacterized protein n=1 Tax=Protopolystoma xenopodis TaxID=117903 RepID=A0A3S5AW23_9PLAT|nr:unnamed protein product [Protopolystoma xenopodis]
MNRVSHFNLRLLTSLGCWLLGLMLHFHLQLLQTPNHGAMACIQQSRVNCSRWEDEPDKHCCFGSFCQIEFYDDKTGEEAGTCVECISVGRYCQEDFECCTTNCGINFLCLAEKNAEGPSGGNANVN